MSTIKMSLMGLSSRVIASALTISSVLILARNLGPRAVGEYFLFLRVVGLLAILTDLGFTQGITVFSGRGESAKQIHHLMIGTSIVWSLVLSFLFIAALKWFGPAILPNYSPALQLATVVTLPFFIYTGRWRYFMVGLGQIGTTNLMQIGSAAMTFLMVMIFIVGMGKGLAAALLIYIGLQIAQALAMSAISISVGRSSPMPRKGLFAEMFRFGLRGAWGMIATVAWQRVPVFVLNIHFGQAAVGVFSVAQQIIEKMLLPMEAMQDAIYRKMAQLPLAEAKAVINRHVRVSGWSMALLLAVAAAALPMAILFVLGPQYRPMIPVALALIPGALAMSTAYLLSTFFVAQLGRPGLMSILSSVTLGMVVLLSVILIPMYGPTGAGFAVAGAQIAGTIVVVIAYLRITGSRALDLMRITSADRELALSQVRALVLLGRHEDQD